MKHLLYFLVTSLFFGAYAQDTAKETMVINYDVSVYDANDDYGAIVFYNTVLTTNGVQSEFVLKTKDTVFDSEIYGTMDNYLPLFYRALYKNNLHKPEVYYKESRGIKNYKLIKDNFKIDWTYTNQTKIVNGNLCYKALCTFRGRNYEAFYSKEIPYSDGPFKFSGLPGLILEINSLDGAVKMKATQITYTDESMPNNPYLDLDPDLYISFKDYKKIYLKYFKKMTGYQPDLDTEIFVPKRYIEYVVND